MKNQIEIFKNQELGEVRTVLINGEPWFVGKDVATCLGYTDYAHAILDHVDEEDRTNSKTQGQNDPELGQRGSWLINESGMYALIFGSKLESAKKFKKWVTHEVLPSIRKHGLYITEELLQDKEKLQYAIEDLKYEKKQLENRNKELEEVRTEYMKQRDKIIRVQIKYGNTKENGRFIPYCILQLVREFIKYAENVEYRDDEIIKVDSRKLIRFVKGLFPKNHDAQSYLEQCLDIKVWEKFTVIPTDILKEDYEPIQDIIY